MQLAEHGRGMLGERSALATIENDENGAAVRRLQQLFNVVTGQGCAFELILVGIGAAQIESMLVCQPVAGEKK